MKKKMNNKGFTLVELIVVLVILAILAAILVPALLGYIDRAKKQQYVLNAKSYLTATQAEFSSLYGQDKSVDSVLGSSANTTDKKTIQDRIQATADVDCDNFSVKIGSGGTNSHGEWTVAEAKYVKGDIILYFNGTSWDEVTDDTALTYVIK